ncbi:hypothetical protein L3X38_023673 [Prunus dulcis]|uniref:Uncharacterized protein n=1 Tax=Prunus dulcis TaxID=3755 RepID=A0AAD4W129_PRUDU|nr:hypothetical protein L3X38_023673 [Prunus dulcis]
MSTSQWQVVIRRTYPWFQPGFRPFEKEPEEEVARTYFRKKFLSVTLPRDLPFGGGKPPNYHLGVEVYHPNFCASSATKVLFDGWDSWTVYAEAASKQFMVQMIKDINTKVIEVIAKNIAQAKKHQKAQRAEPTGSELALLDDMEVEHLATVPEDEVEAEHSVTVPKPEVTSVMSNNLIRLRTL